MAAVRSKAQIPVGSARWVYDEREQVAQFGDQDAEDFAFSARNEVEWLNEHMAEIFGSNQLNVTEIFKTPGKLRGKTPRTARKRNPLEARAPLTDLFSADKRFNNSPSRALASLKEIANNQSALGSASAFPEPRRLADKACHENTDSGYHGMAGDDMEIDELPVQPPSALIGPEADAIMLDPPSNYASQVDRPSEERRTTEGSFHSARENPIASDIPTEPRQPLAELASMAMARPPVSDAFPAADASPKAIPSKHTNQEMNVHEDKDSVLGDEDHGLDVSHSTSESSSPVRPLVRKGSLTFASLPAREPLTTKKSVGARVSRTSNLEQPKTAAITRDSYLSRFTGGQSLGAFRQNELDEKMDDRKDLDMTGKPALAREESDGDGKMAQLHNKSSTQRLHERINLLGKTQPARTTKSNGTTLSVQPGHPDVSSKPAQGAKYSKSIFSNPIDDDDDWIIPPTTTGPADPSIRLPLAKNRIADVVEQSREHENKGEGQGSYERGFAGMQPKTIAEGDPMKKLIHMKSASAIIVPSPRHDIQERPISVSNPSFTAMTSTTPAGSPNAKPHGDGALTASKINLRSIMKSARGLFTSSAGVSAEAKMETMSPSPRSRSKPQQEPLPAVSETGQGDVASSLYPNLPNGSKISVVDSPAKGRKTRASSEKEDKRREKENRERQRADAELQRAREQEAHKVTKQREQEIAAATQKAQIESTAEKLQQQPPQPIRQSPRRQQKQPSSEMPHESVQNEPKPAGGDAVQSMAPPARPQTQLQKAKDAKRPAKPVRDVVSKPKAPPVIIRMNTLSQRFPMNNSALSSNLQETLPPPPPKQPVITKKASNASIQTVNSLKSSGSSVSSKTKVVSSLLAAKQKKEQDELQAQKKLDQRREFERKRAEQLEDAQKREAQQRQEAEKQKAVEDAKKLAQKQAMEKRRLELSKKEQQQREASRPVNESIHVTYGENITTFSSSHRVETGPARPPSRINAAQEFPRLPITHPAPNPAKPPPKRFFEPDHEDERPKPARTQGGQTFQQIDAKRRRTEDEETHEAPVRSTMVAPPIRQSNIRKDGPKPSNYGNNYPSASGSNYPAGPSMHKTTTMNQTYQQHSHQSARPPYPDMAKYAHNKIPFAEAPNPPPPQFKTPVASKHGVTAAPKSSPLYTNGDNIYLEEIATDSEDSDSENERKKKQNVPEWALTPNLDQKLRNQERDNPDRIFGPVRQLVMEEIFTDKNRHHRFRSRTSSANWLGQDRLTEEEIRSDHAAREKMRRDGGWTFGL